ncbi:MAG: hypothetical protein NC541_03290 [bacterium]|nr:hypothetical protein [bacterium]
MKKIVAALTGITILLTSIPVSAAAAETSAVADHAQFVEKESGDVIDIEAVPTQNLYSAQSDGTDIYITRISRNDVYEETLYVDFSSDELTHEYADGTVVTEKLSDVVTITSVPASSEDASLESPDISFASLQSTDYITNEPLTVDSKGNQATLTGVSSYGGYQAMGSRGNYYYAPNIYGYLQRQNAGVSGTYHSHKFEFSAGTKISAAASVIVAFFTNASILGLTLSIATAALGVIVDSVNAAYGSVFEVKTYRWNYIVRLNSNTGTTIFSTYRARDYWKGYNEATGAVYHEYRGNAYDDGFLLSNSDLIRSAIDAYVAK